MEFKMDDIVKVKATNEIGKVIKIIEGGTHPILMYDEDDKCLIDFGKYTKTYEFWELAKM